jgi:hypothetical protein
MDRVVGTLEQLGLVTLLDRAALASMRQPSIFSSWTQPSQWNGCLTCVACIGVYRGRLTQACRRWHSGCSIEN